MNKTLFVAAVAAALSITAYAQPADANAPGARLKPLAGGANQRTSVEGCIGQTLFDGFWRFKVTNLATAQEPGYSNLPVFAVCDADQERPFAGF